jgi:catechol 2,3-dioxygenase-like lactoylglutathione lyase family enzyme
MAATLNHVSISAPDIEASARFYEEVFGLERVPAPNFGYPVVWLRAGDLQVHLFQRDVEAPPRHHFALTVDDFEAVYRKAEQLTAFDRAMGRRIAELPDGTVQVYLRDPAGNLVEVDFPGASRVDRSVVKELPKLEDMFPQSEENRKATLFLRKEAPSRA